MKKVLSVLYRSDTILAVDKPSGLLSVPDRYHEDKPSLSAQVMAAYPSARPLHRLDFETSGVVLFCLVPDVFGWYSDQFEQRRIDKTYTVLTEGRPLQSSGSIDAPLFTQSTGKVIISRQGKSSQTHWDLVEAFRHHAVLRAQPLTGRTHQIRVHLSSIGHPVVGDKLYGSGTPLLLSALKGKKKYNLSRDLEEERPLLNRLALHASSISFQDFTSEKQITADSPVPKDLHVAILKLRQYNGLSAY